MKYTNINKKESNPINETSSIYTSDNYYGILPSSNLQEYKYSGTTEQNMYNEDPISQITTQINNDYRQTIENLRTKTESMNMALEAALVPSIIYGSSYQPYFLTKDKDEYGRKIDVKTISDQYVFQDHMSDTSPYEYVFNCNMIKFKSDKKRNLIYDRTVHIYSQDGDTIESIVNNISKYRNIDSNELKSINYSISHLNDNDILESGIDINTGIPSTLYNLVKMDYVLPFLAFFNGRAVPWDKTIISVDNIDTFVILDLEEWKDSNVLPLPDDKVKAKFQYLDLPFQVDYIKANDKISDGNYPDRYLKSIPIFFFDRTTGVVNSNDHYKQLMDGYDWFANSNGFERIFTKDPYIIYDEFEYDENALIQNKSTSMLGSLFNKRFTELDYRFKIKQFNLLCFELDNNGGGIIKDDFKVESHQFNILKIELERVMNKKRRFKVFYNTRVVYDQDNFLRIKNKKLIADQFAKYMEELTSNVDLYIKEIYKLSRKDVGEYKDPSTGDIYYYDISDDLFKSDTTDKVWEKDEITFNKYDTIIPRVNYEPVLEDFTPDQLKLRIEKVFINNMEEGPTPVEEVFYYNNPDTQYVLNELASQIFKNDLQEVRNTIVRINYQAYTTIYFSKNRDSDRCVQNEWFLRKHLAEMFKYDISKDYYISNMDLLDEVFDFTYKDNLSYDENLKNGLDYIISYDADKIEASIKRGIVSLHKYGAELKEFIDTVSNKLTMNQWSMTNGNTFVIIFRNGKIYEKYNTIKYSDYEFSVEITRDDYKDTDSFEFVFFLNVNNNVLKSIYKTQSIPGGSISNPSVNTQIKNVNLDCIPCNTTLFDPENLVLHVNKLENNRYNDNIDFDKSITAYPIDYTIQSYKSVKKIINDKLVIVESLASDNMMNGLYRVTKQNGGEYFICPKNIPLNTEVLLCSKRQFKYIRYDIKEELETDSYSFELGEEFKYCTNLSQYMVFKNGYILPNTYVSIHSINNTPINKPMIYININITKGDYIEVFYIPNKLTSYESEVDNNSTKTNSNNIEVPNINTSNYIRFKSPLYGVSSKNSLFVFINGEKIPTHFLEDISDTMIKVNNYYGNCNRLEIYSHLDTIDENNIVYIRDGLTHEYKNTNIKNLIRMNELPSYKEPSKLDKLLNDVNYNNLNKMFSMYAASRSDLLDNSDFNYRTKESVLNDIYNDFVIEGDTYNWIANIK